MEVGSNMYYGEMQRLLAYDDIVLVIPQYRLGPLGYLAVSDLAKDDPRGVAGNYGITDMIQGLQWVQDTIAAFGGNKSDITVFG